MSKELDRCFARTVLMKQLQVVIDAIGAGRHMKSNMIEKLNSIYVQLVGDEESNYQSMIGSMMICHFKAFDMESIFNFICPPGASTITSSPSL